MTQTTLRERAIAEALQLVRDVCARLGLDYHDPTARSGGEPHDDLFYCHAHTRACTVLVAVTLYPSASPPVKIVTICSPVDRAAATGLGVDEAVARWQALDTPPPTP